MFIVIGSVVLLALVLHLVHRVHTLETQMSDRRNTEEYLWDAIRDLRAAAQPATRGAAATCPGESGTPQGQ